MRGRFLLRLATCVLAASCATPGGGGEEALLTGAEWGARPPPGEMRPHQVRGIVVHHTATRRRLDRPFAEKMRAVQAFSQTEAPLASGGTKPPWPDVSYHFYVDHAGKAAEGRDASYAGDSNTEYDPAGHLQVVLEGNFEEERPTAAQLSTLRRLLVGLADRYGIPSTTIDGHRDRVETLCPGRNLYGRLPGLRAAVGRSAA